MPDKPKTKSGGKGLKKKLGPFPTYVWIIGGVVIVVGYFYFRNRSGSSAGSANQAVIPSGVIQPPQSAATNPSVDTSSTSPNTFPSDYATTTDLQSAIDQISGNTAASIAAITFPQPSVNITVPPAQVATHTVATKTAAKKAAVAVQPTHIKYYTTKKSVPLKAHQTLHFTRGKGYYAA